MIIENIKHILEEQPNLATALGIEFLSTPEVDTCMARMAVDDRTRQPYGLLSGGASLALAEELAGVGSAALCPDKVGVGINVSGNHLKAARVGDMVTAIARLTHTGKTLHVWNVEIRNQADELISTATVTNLLMQKEG